MITTCPYCYQHIDTQNKEKPAFKEDKILTVPCPNCKLNFILSKDGISEIESEKKKIGLPDSCCNKSSNY